MKLMVRRLITFWLLSGFSLIIVQGLALAMDEVLKREVQMKAVEPSPQSALLALARASQTNCFVDCRDFGRVTPFTPQRAQASFNGMQFDLMSQLQLSSLRWDGTTFLYWKEPDSVEIARLLAPIEERNDVVSVEGPSEIFKAYLNRNPGMEQRWKTPFTLLDLPDELRPAMAQLALWALVDETTTRNAAPWFREATWLNARVALVNSPGLRWKIYLRVLYKVDEAGNFVESTLPMAGINAPSRLAPPVVVYDDDKPIAVDAAPEIPAPAEVSPSGRQFFQNLTTKAESQKLAFPGGEKTVNLDVAGISLSELLTQISRQTGQNLEQADWLEEPRLAVYERDLALPATMQILARLLNARWEQNGVNGWRIVPQKTDRLQNLLTRVGDLATYRFRFRNTTALQERENFTGDFIHQLIAAFDKEELFAPTGVAFTELPTEMQKSLRERIELEYSFPLVGARVTLDSVDAAGIKFRLAQQNNGFAVFLREEPMAPISIPNLVSNKKQATETKSKANVIPTQQRR